jgi:hypothetical protein
MIGETEWRWLGRIFSALEKCGAVAGCICSEVLNGAVIGAPLCRDLSN